jgi:hypothetical protein
LLLKEDKQKIDELIIDSNNLKKLYETFIFKFVEASIIPSKSSFFSNLTLFFSKND